MHENKSFNRNPANHKLYHALMEDLIEDENAMDKGVADTVNDHKRKHDDNDDDDDNEEDPPAGPNHGKKTKRRRTKESESSKNPSSTKETPKGKALSKGSYAGKSASTKEPVKEPIAEMAMDDAGKDVTSSSVRSPGHLTVAADYFFNNDLEYLKPSDLERTYTTSITKIKEAQYEIVGIEDMVPTLWSTIKHAYDKDAAKGIKHWGRKTSLVIKRRVKNLQLGVKSYQKKLNITLPQQTFPEIEFKELYTPSYKPPGVIYEDLTKLKRVMRVDELYKFSDGILKKVQDELHQRILDFCLGYKKEM
ncbi:hypothetical protein Tco_0876829 [Tanacetum coccineum]|uniref:Uncharacterized protein n=1 Tax=Tanacetum coccineum TaxID=301880 RepID=A0ABQ5BWU9_9ASTR